MNQCTIIFVCSDVKFFFFKWRKRSWEKCGSCHCWTTCENGSFLAINAQASIAWEMIYVRGEGRVRTSSFYCCNYFVYSQFILTFFWCLPVDHVTGPHPHLFSWLGGSYYTSTLLMKDTVERLGTLLWMQRAMALPSYMDVITVSLKR